MKQVNEAADADEEVLRISMDAKATVKVGPFARGGKSRVLTKAADHDFEPVTMLTPVGILMPQTAELFLYAVASRVTSDCLVDRLIQWWETIKYRYPKIKSLVINQDNGPENHSRRTQFMQRLVDFVQQYHLNVRLAYYPPYPSRVQRDRTLLGNFRKSLELFLARFGRRCDPVCQDHDLERGSSSGRTGDHRLSDGSQVDQASHGCIGNPV